MDADFTPNLVRIARRFTLLVFQRALQCERSFPGVCNFRRASECKRARFGGIQKVIVIFRRFAK